MIIGRINKRIEIHKPTESQSGTGSTTTTYAKMTGGDRWAAIAPVSGKEDISGEQMEARAIINVRIRYMTGITTDHRIIYGSRTFEINSIANPGERNTELEFVCTEEA